jgi:hypothetical protein
MARSAIGVVGLVSLVAGVVLSAASQPQWRNAVGLWFGARGGQTNGGVAFQDAPICSSMSQLGLEADWAQLDPDFAAGRKALAAGDWRTAIAALRLASLRDPRNADIWNYIGYAHRRLGELGPAMEYYQQALALNPRHRGAHKHVGEVYLMLGDVAKAEEQQTALTQVCLIGCLELGELERAIAMYRDASGG